MKVARRLLATVLGVVAIGNEYGSGMIVTSLAATPRRSRVVLAKAVVVGLATTIVGTIAVYPAYFVARPIQRSGGFVAPGYPDPDLTSEPVLRAMLGTGLLIGIVAVFGVGMCAIVKRTATAIPIVIASFVVPAMIVVEHSSEEAPARARRIDAHGDAARLDRRARLEGRGRRQRERQAELGGEVARDAGDAQRIGSVARDVEIEQHVRPNTQHFADGRPRHERVARAPFG